MEVEVRVGVGCLLVCFERAQIALMISQTRGFWRYANDFGSLSSDFDVGNLCSFGQYLPVGQRIRLCNCLVIVVEKYGYVAVLHVTLERIEVVRFRQHVCAKTVAQGVLFIVTINPSHLASHGGFVAPSGWDYLGET